MVEGEPPEVHFARSGEVSIAYATVGEGPFDLVLVGGWVVSNLAVAWEGPPADFFRRLASFSRLIFFDKRGTGLSDRTTGIPDLARYMAERIAGAELVELPVEEHGWYVHAEPIAGEVERFLRGIWDRGEWEAVVEPDRVLATVLFTDIVGSTAKLSEVGDRRWRELLHEHHAIVRRQLARFRGREIGTAGDGFFATFDGPARGIRAARAIADRVHELGLEVRAGLHTGETELIDGKVGGIAVAIGARIGGFAGPAEVWASSTVKDLTAGSGLVFEDAGEHELKGVSDRWRLYRVVA